MRDEPARKHRLRAIGEYGWAIGDQVVTTGTNFAVAVVVARSLGPSKFGGFVLAVAVWIGILGLGRSLLMQPYTLRVSPAAAEAWIVETRRGAGAGLILGSLAGVGLIAIGLAAGHRGNLGGSLIIVGLFSAPLMLQEFWRAAAFSRRSARLALANDAVWSATQLALLFFFARHGGLDLGRALAAWGCGGVAGAILGALQFKVLPALSRQTMEWGREVLRVGGWFGAAAAIFTVAEQAAIWVVGGIAGAGAVGGLRSVQSVFGPMNLLALAGESVTLPLAAATQATSGARGVLRIALRYSAVLALAIGAYLVGIAAAGTRVLSLVFGDAFSGFAHLIVPIGLATLFGGLVAGGTLGLRATARGRRLVAAALPAAGVKVLLVLALTSASGAVGGAWGFAAAAAVHGAILWFLLLRQPAPAAQ